MVDNKNNYSANLKVEQFPYFKLDNHLAKLDIGQDMVMFFDLEDNYIASEIIQAKFGVLSQRFKKLYLNFIHKSVFNVGDDFENIISYYLPFLTDIEQQQLKFSKDLVLPEGEIIVDYLGYKGKVKSGFVFFDYTSAYVVECDEATIQGNSEEFFNCLFQFVKDKKESEFDDLPCNPFNPYEDLDEDTSAKIKEIQKNLYDLKQSGQLLFVLPALKQILNNEVNSITKSDLLIDEDFRILMPKFNNLEIQLSHLTKVVYVLFYRNPQGINIKQLHLYKKQLLELYSNISYHIDYDKIQQSVDDLVKPESKAIYTHISRIKSAFYKQMDYEFAKNYIVTGSAFGSDMKYISILKETHCQDSQNDNTLFSGITKPFADGDISNLFNRNEFED
jgi:hypothetical protein